jgi:hypothetical protein
LLAWWALGRQAQVTQSVNQSVSQVRDPPQAGSEAGGPEIKGKSESETAENSWKERRPCLLSVLGQPSTFNLALILDSWLGINRFQLGEDIYHLMYLNLPPLFFLAMYYCADDLIILPNIRPFVYFSSIIHHHRFGAGLPRRSAPPIVVIDQSHGP